MTVISVTGSTRNGSYTYLRILGEGFRMKWEVVLPGRHIYNITLLRVASQHPSPHIL